MALTERQKAAVSLIVASDPELGYYVSEAALALHKSHDGLRGKLLAALRKKLNLESAEAYWSSDFTLQSVFDGNVVYRMNAKDWRQTFTLNNSEVTLEGDAIETELSYIDIAQESAVTRGDCKEFFAGGITVESKDNEGLIRIIAPGQGSSGYYPREVLKRDGPNVFKSGTQMFWDHATEAMLKDYPVQQLSRQAAILKSNAFYDDNGPVGEGLYAKYKAFSDYKDKIAERASCGAIGISWMGYAQWAKGKVDGRSTKVAEAIVEALSVDFVTLAGAGGAIANVSESGKRKGEKMKVEIEESELTELRSKAAKFQEHSDANTKLAKANEALKTSREAAAKATIAAKLAKTSLTEKAKEALTNILMRDVPATESGLLDEAKFNATLTDLEKEFAASGGQRSGDDGRVRLGNGGTATGSSDTDWREQRVKLFIRQGYTKEQAEKLVSQ